MHLDYQFHGGVSVTPNPRGWHPTESAGNHRRAAKIAILTGAQFEFNELENKCSPGSGSSSTTPPP
jgi:hypothetical protein